MKVLNSEKNEEYCYKKWGVLIPTFIVDKGSKDLFSGNWSVTKISFPTIFCLQVSKNRVLFKLALLGIGIYFEFIHKRNARIRK